MSSSASAPSWRWETAGDGLRTLWFDRPGRSINVLDGSTLDELEARIAAVECDSSIRGVLIRSAKPAGFCAGADLKALLAFQSADEVEAFCRHGLAVFERLAALAVPTVAFIHGACLGGGLELALACRRRVAMASAVPLQVGTPEVHLGLIPGWGAITRLPRLVGPRDGLNLLITGRSIGYLLARSLGIVGRLAASDDTIDSLNVFANDPPLERAWPKEAWEEAWNRARTQVDEQPGDFPEAQLHILTIAAIAAAHGREAALEATVHAVKELAMSDVIRESITAFVDRGSSEPCGGSP
jgi:enoyl-CoA hydratase/carnithine racemase